VSAQSPDRVVELKKAAGAEDFKRDLAGLNRIEHTLVNEHG